MTFRYLSAKVMIYPQHGYRVQAGKEFQLYGFDYSVETVSNMTLVPVSVSANVVSFR